MNNLKRRQTYYHEGSPAEPVLQGLAHSSSTGLSTTSLSPDYRYILESAPTTPVRITVPLSRLLDLNSQENQQYILEQAAAALGLPTPALLDLSNHRPQPLHKRPRLNTSVSMPTPYADDPALHDGEEKPPLVGASARPDAAGRKTFTQLAEEFPGGWASSRIADCLANFAMCQPCTPYEPQSTTYTQLPTTLAYAYDDTRSAVDGPLVPLQPHSQPPMNPAPVAADQTALFACDDSALMAQYLASYPALQPARVMSVQPSSNREEMVYPVTTPVAKYNSPEETTAAGGLAIPAQPPLMNAPVPPSTLHDPYSVDGGPNSFDPHNGYLRPPPPYSSLHGFEVKDDPDCMDSHGRSAVFDPFPQRTMPARRGPFKDSGQRELTARTRKIGSCIRCRMQRIRCNLDPEDERGPCISCKKIAANSRVYRLNCLRWKITDVKLFKPGQVKGHEWTDRWKDSVVDDIGTWDTSDLRVIHVTEGYTGRSVRLQVRRFHPQDGDKLERSWVSDGVKKSVRIPPYAIVDMDSAKSAFDEYIKNGLIDCCKRLLGPDKLLWQTYAIAIKLMGSPSTNESERKLLGSTLDLWMSVRLTTKSFEIVGNDTLDMPQNLIEDEKNPLYGKIPLPPVMGAQIDSVLIHQIQPQLRRKTLEELQKMTQDKKQKTWLTTYLVTFILLHNIALITKHDADYAKKHGIRRRFAREDNVKEYNLGANTLLAYFHYCNKGIYPFSDECKDQDLQSLAELDDEAMAFVRYTRRFASDYGKKWEQAWQEDEYENEYYYVSQLFEQNWQPRTM